MPRVARRISSVNDIIRGTHSVSPSRRFWLISGTDITRVMIKSQARTTWSSCKPIALWAAPLVQHILWVGGLCLITVRSTYTLKCLFAQAVLEWLILKLSYLSKRGGFDSLLIHSPYSILHPCPKCYMYSLGGTSFPLRYIGMPMASASKARETSEHTVPICGVVFAFSNSDLRRIANPRIETLHACRYSQ